MRDVPVWVWEEFKSALLGSDDLRPARQDDAGDDPFVDVVFEYAPRGQPKRRITVGRRYRPSPQLREGQPVWVRLDGDEITALRLGVVWRHTGSGVASTRIPRGAAACSSLVLCPSCAVFGSIHPNGDNPGEQEETRRARQVSYAGHVRFGNAVTEQTVQPLVISLAPQGMPRPGAGQFYLDSDARTRGDAAVPASREWRAGDGRMLRGRKFYWHTPAADGSPPRRARAGAGQDNEAMSATVELIPAGTVFTMTVRFTDLDPAQVGGLLAALEPGLLLGEDVVRHIGGGRPLGLGSCRTTVEPTSSVWSSAARYGAVDTVAGVALGEFVRRFREQAPREVAAVWPAVVKVLSADAVDGSRVTYPPGAGWAAVDTEKFGEGFEFWKQTSGLEQARKDGRRMGFPLQGLPEVGDADQSMEIVTKASARPLPDRPDRRGRR
ncbi:hypothetical protein ACFQV2_31600 [Actinokineospora soli]|uniref:CRISPR-associated protein n=1 Tax=Actinokineospora soli TaxID=1048753 RepID=A0ABW2TTT8_9PSEU